ncbi:hypothetical protein LIER_41616 [Lithospermum erythrorhizon]|uniref:Carbohydrate kinase PfkB domain-containing protein n=1 Tax=Lithospermum erythrorhizon TaxID=34254 RepID=A0AAV3RFI9_LITER
MALHFGTSSFTIISSSPQTYLSHRFTSRTGVFKPCKVKSSAFSYPFTANYPSYQFKVKASLSENGPLEKDDNLVVCFDFVPTMSGLSLAEAPAFKKAPGGAPANVGVGIARLGGSSAFIGKVLEFIYHNVVIEMLSCSFCYPNSSSPTCE